MEERQPDFKIQTRIEEGPKPDHSDHRASLEGQIFTEVCGAPWRKGIKISICREIVFSKICEVPRGRVYQNILKPRHIK